LTILKIPTAQVFEPLLEPARYKGVYGGRGSGKSHFFGELLVETCQAERGTLAVCIREAQRTLAQSSKRLIESKIASLGVGSGFKLFTDKIETPGDGLIIFRGMQDHTAESIKSLEGFRIAWIDEAQTLSARSLALLRPTIRAENSELWASWNPRRKSDAIDDFLRARKPPGAIVIKANWRDKLLIWDKVLGLGTTDPLAGFAAITSNLVVSFYFAKRGFENVARIIKR
jgi:phage terminase large subunit